MLQLDSVLISNELFDVIPNKIDRAMFMLFYHWGLTYEEIGHCFSVPPEFIKEQIERAKGHVEYAYK